MEMVVVIAVFGVMAALAIPRLSERDAFDQMAAADQLRGSLRHAQRMAAARNREMCVAVTPAGVSFLAAQQAGAGMPCVAPLRSASDGQPLDVTLPAGLIMSPAIRFRFTPAGPLANDGPVPVQRPAQPINIVRGGVGTTSILVHAENGYVQ